MKKNLELTYLIKDYSDKRPSKPTTSSPSGNS